MVRTWKGKAACSELEAPRLLQAMMRSATDGYRACQAHDRGRRVHLQLAEHTLCAAVYNVAARDISGYFNSGFGAPP